MNYTTNEKGQTTNVGYDLGDDTQIDVLYDTSLGYNGIIVSMTQWDYETGEAKKSMEVNVKAEEKGDLVDFFKNVIDMLQNHTAQDWTIRDWREQSKK